MSPLCCPQIIECIDKPGSKHNLKARIVFGSELDHLAR